MYQRKGLWRNFEIDRVFAFIERILVIAFSQRVLYRSLFLDKANLLERFRENPDEANIVLKRNGQVHFALPAYEALFPTMLSAIDDHLETLNAYGMLMVD